MHETNGKLAAGDLALEALVWTLQDDTRAERMLSLTGLTPDGLRAGIGERATQAAVLSFLEAHEPDLIACADAIGVSPAALIAAQRELEA
jgi:adenine/guanine phosphoribosyltransferase-like PRPP-binding protein